MKKIVLFSLLACLVFAGCSKQNETPTASNEEPPVSMYLEKEIIEDLEAPIDEIYKTYSEASKLPGMAVLAAKDGKIIFEKAYGDAYVADADYEAEGSKYDTPVYKKIDNPRKTNLDTLYDLASVTKAMATTQSIMKLVSEGKIDVNEKVATYLEGFEKNGKEDVTVEQLLTHTSGLVQWEPTYLYVSSKEEQLEYIKNSELNPEFKESDKNKESVHYSDFGFMTLGFIIEAVTNQSMDEYVKENIYKPLGMEKTTYKPLENGFTKDEIAATSLGNPYEYKMIDEVNYPDFGYDCTKDAEVFNNFDGFRKYTLIGEVNDGNAGMGAKGVAGHAGLFSTAEDLAILAETMLNMGTYKGVTIYDEDTVKLFTSQHTNVNEVSEEYAYCFALDQSWMGDTASVNVYGHQGFTGPTISMDPDNHLTIIVLTNKMQSGFRFGEDQNPNLYWNVNPMIKEISNEIRAQLGL